MTTTQNVYVVKNGHRMRSDMQEPVQNHKLFIYEPGTSSPKHAPGIRATSWAKVRSEYRKGSTCPLGWGLADMTGRMSAGSLPPILLHGPALMSPLMPESRQTHVATLRCGRVRLTTLGLLGLTNRDAAGALPSADAGANPASPNMVDRHMELDRAVSQGADAGAIPVGSYNYTESGNNMTALITKSGRLSRTAPALT